MNIIIKDLIINISEVNRIRFYSLKQPKYILRIEFGFKNSERLDIIHFSNEEEYEIAKSNLINICKPTDITIKMPEINLDNYMDDCC